MPSTPRSLVDGRMTIRKTSELATRNGAPEDEHASHDKSLPSMSRHRGARLPSHSSASEQSFTTTLGRGASMQSKDSTLEHTTKSRGNSIASSASDAQNRASIKKKKSGVLGFLTLKEPSTSAWEEYAAAQKKMAAQKSGRSNVAGHAGMPSQKLPDFVPPTNSKWNGLPANTKPPTTSSRLSSKRSSSISSSAKHASRSITTSYTDNNSDYFYSKRYGSTSSRPGRSNSTSQPPSSHGSVGGYDLSKGPENPEAKTTVNSIHPPLQKDDVTLWSEPPYIAEDSTEDEKNDEDTGTFLHAPSPVPDVADAHSFASTPELEMPWPIDYGTSPEQSPQTPPADYTLKLMDAGADNQEAETLHAKSPPSPAVGTFWHSSDTDTEAEPKKPQRPSSMNFSRPMRQSKTPFEANHQGIARKPIIEENENEDRELLGATLRDETGCTSPFLFEQSHLMPLITPTTSRDVSQKDITPPLTTGTATTVITSPPRPQVQPATSSTLTASSARSSPSASTGSSLEPARRPASPSPSRSNSDAVSLAPSELSVQWKMTSKQRLGLGSRLSRIEGEENLPWAAGRDAGDRPLSDVSAKRQSSASQATIVDGSSGGKFSKKRLSIRLGRK